MNPAPASAATSPSTEDAFTRQVLLLTNQYRATFGLTPVIWNQAVTTAVAQPWAENVNSRINKGTLDMATIHRPDGGRSLLPAGFDWYSEIIAINNSAQQIVDWWIASPSHRAAMLDPTVTDVGIGYVKTTKAGWGGMYVAVENLVGYPSTRAIMPPAPAVKAGDIAAVDSAGDLYIYPTAHGSDLWQRRYMSSGWSDAVQIDITDWNADGIQDVLARWKSGMLSINYGLSNGKIGPRNVIGYRGWADYDVTVAKWSATDAYPALIARQKSTGYLYYYKNSNGFTFSSRTMFNRGWQKISVAALDYDADGKSDILAKMPDGQLKLYRGNGAGGLITEGRRVIGLSGWDAMDQVTAITNHLGDGQTGLLARDTAGNLHYYPVVPNRINSRITIGRGGWDTLVIGS